MTGDHDFLDSFHSVDADGAIRISGEQASRFAKEVAGDYNPLHDSGARRFCVPGDLLFALALDRYGLSTRMTFGFRGMVDADEPIHCPDTDAERFALTDEGGGVFMEVERGGEITRDRDTIQTFILQYTAFSGRTFPHYLIPLLAEKRVMFHPERPMVIYDSMGFELVTPALSRPALELDESTMDVNGRRGEAVMRFTIEDEGQPVGSGWKKLLISGVREYDEAAMNEFVERFNRHREAYLAERANVVAGDGGR